MQTISDRIMVGFHIPDDHVFTDNKMEACKLANAAEDLLEACEFALEVWREHWLNPSDPKSIKLAEVYVKIKRAVSKAKGDD